MERHGRHCLYTSVGAECQWIVFFTQLELLAFNGKMGRAVHLFAFVHFERLQVLDCALGFQTRIFKCIKQVTGSAGLSCSSCTAPLQRVGSQYAHVLFQVVEQLPVFFFYFLGRCSKGVQKAAKQEWFPHRDILSKVGNKGRCARVATTVEVKEKNVPEAEPNLEGLQKLLRLVGKAKGKNL